MENIEDAKQQNNIVLPENSNIQNNSVLANGIKTQNNNAQVEDICIQNKNVPIENTLSVNSKSKNNQDDQNIQIQYLHVPDYISNINVADNYQSRYPKYKPSELTIKYFTCCKSKKQRMFLSIKINSQGICLIFIILFILLVQIILSLFIIHKMKSTLHKYLSYFISIILYILFVVTLLDTATTVPGHRDTSKQITEQEFDLLKPSVQIKGETFPLSYCPTCKIIKDLRTFHCSQCDKCISRHDHHCPYINNCVGKFNHFKFLIFIGESSIYSVAVFVICVIYFVVNKPKIRDLKVGQVLVFAIVGLTSISFAFTMVPFFLSHVFIISKNITTNENIRHKHESYLFDQGCRNNWKEVIEGYKSNDVFVKEIEYYKQD